MVVERSLFPKTVSSILFHAVNQQYCACTVLPWLHCTCPTCPAGPASTDGSMSMAARHHQQQQQHQQQQPATATAAAAMPEPAAAPAPVVDLLHLEATAPSIGGLRTPLMMAIIGGHTAVVNVFLEFRRKFTLTVGPDILTSILVFVG